MGSNVKKYLHKKVLNIPLYKGKFIIILSNDAKLVKTVIKNFDHDDVYGHAHIDEYNGWSGYFVVLNFHYDFKGITHGVIAHEAIHVANFILDDRDVVADWSNVEPQTYLAQWITDEIYKFIKSKKLLNKIYVG